MRKDLIFHFLACFVLMCIFYFVPFGFWIVMLIGIVKEYGVFNWFFELFGKIGETKDVDDVAADFLGASFGYLILWAIT